MIKILHWQKDGFILYTKKLEKGTFEVPCFHPGGGQYEMKWALIKKSAWMMERLDKALKKAILEDDYFSMDESYYTVLTKEKNSQGKGVRKGYIWAALGNTVNIKF